MRASADLEIGIALKGRISDGRTDEPFNEALFLRHSPQQPSSSPAASVDCNVIRRKFPFVLKLAHQTVITTQRHISYST